MKCDQIAYYAHNAAQALAIKQTLGLVNEQWVVDDVIGRVRIGDNFDFEDELSYGRLEFCYKFGAEIEILHYTAGPNWHATFTSDYRALKPFVSHIGYHLDDGEDWPFIDAKIVQEMLTVSHTNEYVVSRNRTYHYKIFEIGRAHV